MARVRACVCFYAFVYSLEKILPDKCFYKCLCHSFGFERLINFWLQAADSAAFSGRLIAK